MHRKIFCAPTLDKPISGLLTIIRHYRKSILPFKRGTSARPLEPSKYPAALALSLKSITLLHPFDRRALFDRREAVSPFNFRRGSSRDLSTWRPPPPVVLNFAEQTPASNPPVFLRGADVISNGRMFNSCRSNIYPRAYLPWRGGGHAREAAVSFATAARISPIASPFDGRGAASWRRSSRRLARARLCLPMISYGLRLLFRAISLLLAVESWGCGIGDADL